MRTLISRVLLNSQFTYTMNTVLSREQVKSKLLASQAKISFRTLLQFPLDIAQTD